MKRQWRSFGQFTAVLVVGVAVLIAVHWLVRPKDNLAAMSSFLTIAPHRQVADLMPIIKARANNTQSTIIGVNNDGRFVLCSWRKSHMVWTIILPSTRSPINSGSD